MADTLETIWVLRHGARQYFSADMEFTKNVMTRFLISHDMALNERQVLRRNKTGIVERKHQTVKVILERLQLDATTASDSTHLSRGTFLSNTFCRSSILSDFERVRGYKLTLPGVSAKTVPPEHIDAHKDEEPIRALQRLHTSCSPRVIRQECLSPATRIYYQYKSSEQSEPVKWRPDSVISPSLYFVQIYNEKGRKSHLSYEDVWLRPSSALTEKLGSSGVEDYIV